MKKGFKIVGIGIVLLVIGYYAYTASKKSSALVNVMHQDAKAAFKIGIHDIKETLFWDAITSPSYYYDKVDTSSQSDDDKTEEADNGITLQPYNLVAFVMPEMPQTLFSVFEVYHSADFNAFIKKELSQRKTTPQEFKQGLQYAVLKDKKAAIAWNANQLVLAVALNLDETKAKTVFEDILIHKKTIDDKTHPILKNLASDQSHVVYSDGENNATLNLEDCKIVFEGEMRAKTSTNFTKEASFEGLTDDKPSFELNANLEHLIPSLKSLENISKASFFAKNQLDFLEIIDNIDGNVHIGLHGKIMQNDTIITYDYDENFEKVETKTVQQKEVPNLFINLGSKDQKLYRYLRQSNSINGNGIFTPIPLYHFYVKEKESHLSFTTDTSAIQTQKRKTTNFLECEVNFEALQQDIGLAQTETLFSLLSSLNIEAHQKGGNSALWKGSLSGKNEDINILSQLYFGLQAKDDATP